MLKNKKLSWKNCGRIIQRFSGVVNLQAVRFVKFFAKKMGELPIYILIQSRDTDLDTAVPLSPSRNLVQGHFGAHLTIIYFYSIN